MTTARAATARPGTARPGTARTCDRETGITRSLLGYGVIAGPVYVGVSLAEALTRDGFDLTRHAWSLLANGDLGWVHIAVFVLTGAMTVAFAVGLRRAHGRGWAPRLLAVYGLSLLAAGAFRADPAGGFPRGVPAGEASWHGVAHLVSGGVGFACLVAACFVLARRCARSGQVVWAWSSRAIGVLFAAGFLAVASGAGATWANLAFTGAVVLGWAWIGALAVHAYRNA
ncbi:DUF998 domain-containing protein [Microbispora bryophytorum]|uniref:DUF998 domain-containing protein n=1 Tax=Microbispora bryophytorum TaxID=1460882 RepID=A0A8H9GX65_9ACTN|nr:DUF998 domain-containing protein [Microbispora bryophytorum]MBD3140156.1 DUF998 domain-containing protein [Microbispora bryophytorum]TQS02269.1 DUF998 domain-containing protein [Microbispora bryophytorum]GGO06457.1 hypothetical protein GCM10011574_19120 [Microbispora bryophytorum]